MCFSSNTCICSFLLGLAQSEKDLAELCKEVEKAHKNITNKIINEAFDSNTM